LFFYVTCLSCFIFKMFSLHNVQCETTALLKTFSFTAFCQRNVGVQIDISECWQALYVPPRGTSTIINNASARMLAHKIQIASGEKMSNAIVSFKLLSIEQRKQRRITCLLCYVSSWVSQKTLKDFEFYRVDFWEKLHHTCFFTAELIHYIACFCLSLKNVHDILHTLQPLCVYQTPLLLYLFIFSSPAYPSCMSGFY